MSDKQREIDRKIDVARTKRARGEPLSDQEWILITYADSPMLAGCSGHHPHMEVRN